ncbi:MAG: GH3 auxin-responsive promoter family protein, partial [Bacteroidota bacterium]
VNPEEGLPYHEWFVEFSTPPIGISEFAELIDQTLQRKNSYYKDLRVGNVLQELKVRPVRTNTFIEYMKSKGKLGGQNKVPRLTNDRIIADELSAYAIK